MEKLKIKLTFLISMMALAITMLIFGVFAVGGSHTINLSGDVDFTLSGEKVYIKDIRLSTGGQEESVKSFIPGFVDSSFTLNLGAFEVSGQITLTIDVINTTSNFYSPSSNSTISNASFTISGQIEGDNVSPIDINQNTEISGSIILNITPSATTIDIINFNITLEEVSLIQAISTNESLGNTVVEGFANVGEEVSLSVNFEENVDGDFLGWRANSQDGEFVSTLPDYSFVYSEGMPTVYYAEFTSPNSYLVYDYDAPLAGEAELTNCNEGAVNVIVPSKISRSGSVYDVTAITDARNTGYAPFRDAQDTLESLVLPQSLKRIGDYGLGYCDNITSFSLPEGVTEIGDTIFVMCTNLESVHFPASVESIGSNLFSGCNKLLTITVDENNAYYANENDALLNKDKTTLLAVPAGKSGVYTIPSTVKTIAIHSIFSCTRLTNIIFPEGLETIVGDGFTNCTGLTEINLPSGLRILGEEAFSGCTNVTEINVNSANNAFSSVDGVLFDGSKTTLVMYPLGRSGTYEVPEGVTMLGNSSFANCNNLTSIVLSSTLTIIGEDVFVNCTRLTSITIPANVTRIDIYTFAGCTRLTTMVVEATTPPTIWPTTFPPNLTTLQVPSGSVDAYKTAQYWSEYADIITAIS